MKPLEIMDNKEVCKIMRVNNTAQLAYLITSGQAEIGIALPVGSIGNGENIVTVYKDFLVDWCRKHGVTVEEK